MYEEIMTSGNAFPLYDTLCCQVKTSKDVSAAQKTKIVKSVAGMVDSKQELVYAIIKQHQLTSGDDIKGECMPYNGMISGNTLEFNIDAFPSRLKQILLAFVNIHENQAGSSQL